VSAELFETATIPYERADDPLWARLVRASVLVPVVLLAWIVVASVMALRPLLFTFRLMSNPASLLGGGVSFGRMLAAFGFGAVAGSRWRTRRSTRMSTVLRLIDGRGDTTTARIALPPGHGFDLRRGDTLDLWGRRHHDGTLRTFHARNRRTGFVLEPRPVPTATWVVLAVTAAVLLASGLYSP
jgi:hypothetical protein